MSEPVDLDKLQPVTIAEVAARPNRTFQGVPPELFRVWWTKNGKHVKALPKEQIARAAWYACAESPGCYEDDNND
jgi:hypothetical protein